MTRCCECIVHDVARAFDVLPVELRLPDRRRRIAYARFAAYRMMRQEAKLSMPQIGRMLGYRHHTSVMDGLAMAEKLLLTDPVFASRYEEARQSIHDYLRPDIAH